MPKEPIRAPLGVNVPGLPMAGFQLTLHGRIWVTPEESGYSYPACIYCPQMQYTAEGLRRQFNGTVVLELTIDPDRHPKDIRVKVGLPFGLTQQAIETVKEWRLKPAIGPDGKPAAVREVVELGVSCY